jgi:hypothetical protein
MHVTLFRQEDLSTNYIHKCKPKKIASVSRILEYNELNNTVDQIK